MGHLAAANCNVNLSHSEPNMVLSQLGNQVWSQFGFAMWTSWTKWKVWKRDVREHVGKVWKKEREVRKSVKSVEKGKECEEARWEGASCNWTRSLHICHRRKLLREGIFQTYFSEQEYLLSTFNSFRSLTPISSRFWSNNLIHIIMIWHFNLKRGRNRINMVKK